MPSLSVNQLVSETRKAMIGKGFSFGVADDIAFAVGHLARYDIAPSAEITHLLHAPLKNTPQPASHQDDAIITNADSDIADVMAAIDLADAHAVSRLVLVGLLYPQLSLALIALRQSAPTGSWAGQDGALLHHLFTSSPGDITLYRNSFLPEAQSDWPARIDIDQDAYEYLKEFAHHTYVPSSAKSREAGAGAGLNDND